MILKVKVKPNANENKFDKIKDNEYIAYLKEKAEKGRANLALIKLIAKEFNVSFKNVKIKTPISRNKIIEIKD